MPSSTPVGTAASNAQEPDVKRRRMSDDQQIDGSHTPIKLEKDGTAPLRRYYTAHGVEAQDTSLGHLIKQKLAEFLPRMVDLKTVDEIKREGGILGQQLIEVLLDERAAIKARERNAKEPAVKIEIDSD